MAQHVKAARLENRAANTLLESTDGVRCRVFSALVRPETIPSALYVAVRVPPMPRAASGPAASASQDVLLMDPLTRTLFGPNDVLEVETSADGHVTAVLATTPERAPQESG